MSRPPQGLEPPATAEAAGQNRLASKSAPKKPTRRVPGGHSIRRAADQAGNHGRAMLVLCEETP
jgi:hypothetical protein